MHPDDVAQEQPHRQFQQVQVGRRAPSALTSAKEHNNGENRQLFVAGQMPNLRRLARARSMLTKNARMVAQVRDCEGT